jgi:hypothetical protein
MALLAFFMAQSDGTALVPWGIKGPAILAGIGFLLYLLARKCKT